MLETYQYPHTQAFYTGNLAEDTIDALASLSVFEENGESDAPQDIYEQLAKEDELSEIYDELFDCLKMTKADMIQVVKKTLTRLEDKNKEFCDRQSYAVTLLPKSAL